MAVITISRQFGAGGKTLGKMIANELDYTFADSDIIQQIAQEANVSPQWVESFEKEAGTKLSRVISSMVSQRWIDRILKDERGYLDERIYLDYLVLIIAKMADEGDVVLLGRGSQYILNDHPDAYHVLLIDELQHRIKFIVDHYDVSEKQAARVVNNEEKRRFSLYSRLGKKDYDNPALYHLVLNMNRFTLEQACKMICDLVNN
ncbi:MAG: cytidylate kinase-like family protein [Deltaproteobacteria bacterium]|nr:cytidylate kinase-like family protein [Deltaproteobacteria bacterium]